MVVLELGIMKLKNESHRQQGEQKSRSILSREEKPHAEGTWSQKGGKVSERFQVMVPLSRDFIKILFSLMKGNPLYPNNIGSLELYAMHAFLSISDCSWDSIMHSLQAAAISRCMEWFQDSPYPVYLASGPMVNPIESPFP
jgi:hypothetical protein